VADWWRIELAKPLISLERISWLISENSNVSAVFLIKV
jgi:hypothetical protein